MAAPKFPSDYLNPLASATGAKRPNALLSQPGSNLSHRAALRTQTPSIGVISIGGFPITFTTNVIHLHQMFASKNLHSLPKSGSRQHLCIPPAFPRLRLLFRIRPFMRQLLLRLLLLPVLLPRRRTSRRRSRSAVVHRLVLSLRLASPGDLLSRGEKKCLMKVID